MKEIELRSPKELFLEEMEKVLSDRVPAKWTDQDIEKAKERTSPTRMKTAMYASIPMVCRGRECPFSGTCEFFREGTHPEGDSCPYEMGLVKAFMADYIEQLDIETDNWMEMGQIRDLVDQEVQLMRKSKYLAKEDFIQENVVGFDSDGDPVMKKELHQAVELEDKIYKRKAQMLKQLLATREARMKAGAQAMDNATAVATMVEKLRKLQSEEDAELKRRLGIIDVDEYIQDDDENDYMEDE